MKKLKISKDFTESNVVDNKRFDTDDDLFSKKHYGYYIPINNKKSTNRLYFCYDFYKEYYDKKKLLTPNIKFQPPKKSKLLLYDNHKKYSELIKNIIQNVFMSEEFTLNIIKEIYGLDILLKALENSNIQLINESKIDVTYQKLAYTYCYDNKLPKSYHANLRQFFGKLEKVYSYIPAVDNYEGSKTKPREGLASSIVYKLDYYARENLDLIISRVKEYDDWLKEYDYENLFNIENLAHTYFSRINKWGSQSTGFNRTLNDISIRLHSIDLHCWNYKKDGIYFYSNEEQKKYHEYLLELSNKGINIDITNEKMLAVWHKAIFPDFPLKNDAKKSLIKIFPSREDFVKKCIFRLRRQMNINIDILDIYTRIFPTIHEIYPLILLLLAREGLNTETLFNWTIKKDFNEKKVTLGNKTSVALVVESLKVKANVNLTCVIANDSEQLKYIDFYINWMTKYYLHSDSNKFLQYIPASKYHQIIDINIHNFIFLYKQKKSFFKKYNITNFDGKNIENIKHSRLRVYGNYADYMRGLTNFERQLKKGHKHIDTQRYYENNMEWKNQNNHKINNIQQNIINIIREKETDDKFSILFQGPLANCSNPKKPTFIGTNELNKNEVCSSWSKCLTMCDKANVIPKIHGPVIYAWILHMEEEDDEYIREMDWEKEYLYDYECAKNVFSGFTLEEKDYSKNNAFKHKTFIKRRFHKKFIIRKDNYA